MSVQDLPPQDASALSPPNVLLVLSDEHSFRCFSHLARAGGQFAREGEPVYTPVLDALAGRSAVFHQTYCQTPLCTPSRICMLTGRSPMHSGGWTNESMMRPDISTLPGTLAAAGYETCLVGKMHLGGNRQFVGFRHRPYGDLKGATGHQWERPLHRKGQPTRERTAHAGITEVPESELQEQVVVRESVAFLREHRAANPQQPWFLCASLSRPHFPLTAPRRHIRRYWSGSDSAQGTGEVLPTVPEPKVGRTGDTAHHPMTVGMAAGFRTEEIDHDEMMRARAAYFACVDYLDEILGDFLAMLERDGLLENTIIIYTSDHGELAGEHGLWWKNSWHEAACRVPFMIQLPAHRRGELAPVRLQTPVSLADLYPTLCGLCGVSAPPTLDGVDLAPAIFRGTEPQRGPVFVDNPTPRWGEGSANRIVRAGQYKYVAFADMPDLLFDLARDPLEQSNLLVANDPSENVEALGKPDSDSTGPHGTVAEGVEVAEVAAKLRGLVDESWDFQAAAAQFALDQAMTQAHALPVDQSWGNLYHMPNGTLTAADTTLYEPVVISDAPARLFADWPGDKSREKEE